MDKELQNKLNNYRPGLNPGVWDNIASQISASPVLVPWWKKWWVISTAIIASFVGGLIIYTLLEDGKQFEPNKETISQTTPELATNSVSSSTSITELKRGLIAHSVASRFVGGNTGHLDQSVENVNSNSTKPSKTNNLQQEGIPGSEQGKSQFDKNQRLPQQVNEATLQKNSSSVVDSESIPTPYSIDYIVKDDNEAFLQKEQQIYLNGISEIEPGQVLIPDSESDKVLPAIDNKVMRHAIDVVGGMLVSYRTLDSDVHHQLVEHKNQNEHRTVSTSFGIIYSYNIATKWQLSSGVMLTSYGEVYDFQHELISHRAKNNYRYVSIPVGIRREMLSARKWSVAVGIGARYNFLNKAKSSWVDLSTISAVEHSNEQKKESPFNTKTFSWNGDLYFRYHISPKVHFTIQETIDRFGNSIYKSDVNLDQRPYSFNTTLGIGVNF